MKITICGGGSLGHVCIGVLSCQKGVEVSVLTRKPERWENNVRVMDLSGKAYEGIIRKITDRAADVIPHSDIVFFCLPGYAIENELKKIKPYLSCKTIVGTVVSSTGFFFFAHRILGVDAKLFGFQRVPFIARTVEYGKSASLLGYKTSLNVALENVPEPEIFRLHLEKLFLTPTHLLSSYFEAALTNSNPILHTGRLYSMWKDWNGETFDHNILFYKEWTVEASQILMDMDAEFMNLLNTLPVRKGVIPSLLDYYESRDAISLCEKIRSIPAFQNITSPMVKVEDGWIPDFKSRYFREDFPYGLFFIKRLCDEKGIVAPMINKVYSWGMSKCTL